MARVARPQSQAEGPPELSHEAAERALGELTENLEALRDVFQTKRQRLWARGIGRTKWQKGLHIGSGIIALFSGGAITSVVTTLTSSLTVKILAAVLAFLSGIISLVASTLFDEKETQQMFEGAAQYAAFRDRAQSLYDRRYTLSVHQFADALERLRTDSNKLTKDYDHLLSSLSSSGTGFVSRLPLTLLSFKGLR